MSKNSHCKISFWAWSAVTLFKSADAWLLVCSIHTCWMNPAGTTEDAAAAPQPCRAQPCLGCELSHSRAAPVHEAGFYSGFAEAPGGAWMQGQGGQSLPNVRVYRKVIILFRFTWIFSLWRVNSLIAIRVSCECSVAQHHHFMLILSTLLLFLHTLAFYNVLSLPDVSLTHGKLLRQVCWLIAMRLMGNTAAWVRGALRDLKFPLIHEYKDSS